MGETAVFSKYHRAITTTYVPMASGFFQSCTVGFSDIDNIPHSMILSSCTTYYEVWWEAKLKGNNMDKQGLKGIPELASLMEDADHIDIKIVEANCNMRQFIAGMFNYYPSWIKNLYRIRWGFVRLLGMKQEGIPQKMAMRPEDVAMDAGEQATIFKVSCAKEDHYWVAGASESHLTAYLGVVVEPLATTNRFHVITIVHYHKWTGPVYFNVIRPFHHIVVANMAKAGVANSANLQSIERAS